MHHYTLELNCQSAKRIAAREPRPKRSKTQQIDGKLFWYSHGISLINNLEKDQIINSNPYVAQLEDVLNPFSDTHKGCILNVDVIYPKFHCNHAPLK